MADTEAGFDTGGIFVGGSICASSGKRGIGGLDYPAEKYADADFCAFDDFVLYRGRISQPDITESRFILRTLTYLLRFIAFQQDDGVRSAFSSGFDSMDEGRAF